MVAQWPDGIRAHGLAGDVGGHGDRPGHAGVTLVWYPIEPAALGRIPATHVCQESDAAGSLPDNFIRSLLVDDRGQLWVGSNSGGLSRYDPQTDGFTSFPVGANGTSDGTISVLISDRRGGLWIGTGHGIDHLDGATGRIDPPDAGLPRDTITALLLDHAGALWVGTRKGLLRRARADSQFLPYPLSAPEGPAPVIRALHEDEAGRIWIGIDLNGAFIIEPGTDAPRRLLETPGSGRPLIDNISAICDVDKSEVWLATAESGIVRVDTTSWKVVREQRDLTRSKKVRRAIRSIRCFSTAAAYVGRHPCSAEQCQSCAST